MEGSAPGTLSPWGKSIILFSRGVTALFFVFVEEERVYIARIVTFTTLIDCFTSVCARGTRLLVSQLIKFNKATKLPCSAFDPAVRMALAPFRRERAVKEILLVKALPLRVVLLYRTAGWNARLFRKSLCKRLCKSLKSRSSAEGRPSADPAVRRGFYPQQRVSGSAVPAACRRRRDRPSRAGGYSP